MEKRNYIDPIEVSLSTVAGEVHFQILSPKLFDVVLILNTEMQPHIVKPLREVSWSFCVKKEADEYCIDMAGIQDLYTEKEQEELNRYLDTVITAIRDWAKENVSVLEEAEKIYINNSFVRLGEELDDLKSTNDKIIKRFEELSELLQGKGK